MLRLLQAAATRERNLTVVGKSSLLKNSIFQQKKSDVRFLSSSVGSAGSGSPDVAVQLDYYMSLQFAGIASALVNDIYQSKGISNLQFLPTCPVGLEAARVRAFQNANPTTLATFGSVEQNIFTPTLHADPSLNVSGVATTFRRSPLCVASLGPLKKGDVIGAHEDTVELLQRIFPDQKVVASPRGSKNTDLLEGTYQGIQAYTTTEVPALHRLMEGKGLDPNSVEFQVLENGTNGVELGYSQMLFVANEALESPDRREAATAFLEATSEGWQNAIRNPDEAIEAVAEAQKMLKLDDEANDHWHPSLSFQREMLELMNGHVKEGFIGDRLGVLHPNRWGNATQWLLEGKEGDIDPSFGLDQTSLWQPPSNLLAGNEIGRDILQEAKTSAGKFNEVHGRKPSLAVITVGDLSRYGHSQRRVQLYSNPSNSWFTKTDTGEANGFDVTEINLDAASTTTESLLSEIYKIRNSVDGVQVMWPFPDGIDSARVYNAVPLDKDVDGIHFVGQQEIGNKHPYPPVTPAGAMELIKKYGVDVRGKHVVVVGRSPITGSPVAHMLREAGAAVTVLHTDVDKDTFQTLVGSADVLVTSAGHPGAIQASWLKDGVEVINIGTTFSEEADSLLSDVEGDIASKASRYSPVPGGVGPLSSPMLFRNVAKAAWDQMEGVGSASTWEEEPAKLRKSFHFDSYTEALQFAEKVNEMSTIMDHHANISIVHKCVDGVDLEMEFFSFEAKELTEKDYDAAKAVDLIHGGNPIKMSDYSYDLKQDSIALFPAELRGSSKLLQVDSQGGVSYKPHFANSIPEAISGCHVVFNNSRVLDARLSVEVESGKKVELMLLDLGNIDAALPCSDHTIQAMIRSEAVVRGGMYAEPVSGAKIEVVDIKGIWEEDEESGGNGCDCVVRIHSSDDIGSFLGSNGSVPIPPYLHREAVPSDKQRYNNVYAKDGGSVAAPTAGLHFTDEVLRDLGETNTSQLTLHVGAGTFMPVLSHDARDHSMHAEHFFVNVGELRTIVKALEQGKPLLVVGTTSTRTLESLFWLGVKRMRGLPNSDNVKQLELKQFEWIPLSVGDGKYISPVLALNTLIDGMSDHEVISGQTSLMITPNSYKFKVIDHLITNFHAPDSTLMLLVSAFLGKQSDITKIYEDAQTKGYRFLSYGDACLFSRPGTELPSERK